MFRSSLALLTVLALTGCPKVKRGGGGGERTAQSPSDGGVLVAEPREVVAPGAPARQLLRYLPATSQTVVFLSLAALHKSPLFADLSAQGAGAPWSASIGTLVAGCNFQPWRDVDRFVITMHPLARMALDGVVVQGRFHEAELMACLERNANTSTSSAVVTRETHHGHTLYRFPEDRTLVFLAPDTVVVGGTAWVSRLAEGAHTDPPADLDRLASGLEGRDAWFVSTDGLTGADGPKDMAGWFHFDAGVDGGMTMSFATATLARQMADATRTSKIPTEFGTVSATAHDTSVELHFTMDQAQSARWVQALSMILR